MIKLHSLIKEDIWLKPYHNRLIEKGLLNKNRSITVDVINILQNPKAQELLKKAIENYEKNTGRYSPVSTRIY